MSCGGASEVKFGAVVIGHNEGDRLKSAHEFQLRTKISKRSRDPPRITVQGQTRNPIFAHDAEEFAHRLERIERPGGNFSEIRPPSRVEERGVTHGGGQREFSI